MENHLCFDPGTTPTHLTTYIQEHSQKLDLINFLSEMCVKISSQDVKRFGFDKVKEFRVSDSVFENMFNSFKVFEPDELLDQKRFQHDNGINSGFFLSFDQFLKHSKGLDHFEESLELDFCARNSFDSFVFKDNSFNLSCYRYALITGNLFASTCALDEFIVKTLLEQKSLRAKTDFCYDSVLKSDLELLYSNSDHVRHVLKMFYDISCLESILIYNTFFDKSSDPWISNSRSIMCPDTILVYNTYFDRLHDDLKRVLHVLGKETLVSDLNKYLSCTYDPEGENDVPLGSAPGKTGMHGMIMESSKDICSLFDPYLPNHEDSTHEITWKVKMFEADQRRLFSQFEVREFCDNLVEGVVKALKDDFEKKPLNYTHQGPLLGTRRPMDVDLYPIFYVEDDHLDEIGPTFDEKALSITPIIMENRLCFDPGTTPTPLTTYIQEHCEKHDLINFLSEMCVKISSQDVKRFGFDKVKEFRVSDSVFKNMFNSFKVFEPDELLDQKRFQHDNGINSVFVLSFDQFLKHSNGFDHFEESLELDLQLPDFCARNSFDSFVFKENSFNLSSYRYLMITGNLFASTCALDEFMVKTLLEQKSLRVKTDFCCDSVLKSDLELLYSYSDHVRNVLKIPYDISCLESIMI
ncbi:hypothetical protein DY000_02030394 [Brassica cretica]|uniref:Uncharacterized protein n=1 Tax=Brassica cretica TaxID=69181 RepID=A0ABQ7DLZ3_BRACR|nr:hypothetical protein DY000_02030394 [Brassica cretica]